MSEAAVVQPSNEPVWILPARARVGVISLIVAECAIFTIFVVAYLFYIGKSLSGPKPKDVLELPIFNTICLLSSSLTIHLAIKSLNKAKNISFAFWWFITMALGVIFLVGTAREWYRLIYEHGLTITTNLFGTTFYSLVGLHAFHVTVGLIVIGIIMIFTVFGKVDMQYSKRIDAFSSYWHFVDAVWVVVFTVVYVIGR